ncbi:MAG TPA: shikimate dehydrogenase [Pseudomonadales bacterium]|nr:shikimate dehydrogenase [Pseudomonadales bacterium]
MDHYAVIGHPVAHSLSPRIHARFAEQTGEVIDYVAIDAPLDDFVGSVRAAFAGGLRGANITVPFKGDACRLADHVEAQATRAGAANTLRLEADGSLSAFNTDGIGLVRDLTTRLGCELNGATLVLVGAGGAAAGVIEPLCRAGVADLVIVNRTFERARVLAERFADIGPVRALALARTPPADVLVNATAASLAGELPALPDRAVCAGTLAYDMMYAITGTPFMSWARALGAARSCDGIGMLVEQAAEAFWLWRGVRPDVNDVLTLLRPASPIP